MEKNEISKHEVRVFLALSESQKWLSNAEITDLVGEISGRTVRAHTLKLVKLGLVDQAEVFPAHRFRWSDKAAKRNRGYHGRLTAAAEVFGLGLAR